VTVGEQFDLYAADGNWRMLNALLDGLGEQGGNEARAWYRTNRTALSRTADHSWADDPDGSSVKACRDLLAVALAPSPERAAAWFGYHHYWRSDGGASLGAIVQRMADNGRQWCADFLAAASSRMFTGDFGSDAGRLARIALPLVRYYSLPAPMGQSFAQGWVEHYRLQMSLASWERQRRMQPEHPEGGRPAADPASVTVLDIDADGRVQVSRRVVEGHSLVEAWRADPVLPEALSAAIARPGTLGALVSVSTEGWELGPAVAAMVAEGRLDRERLVEDCLTALTRQAPASSQKAVGVILGAVGFSAADAMGRAPLLQGLMATAQGAVTSALLPVLLEIVESPEEMGELALTVFSRKEKRQRSELLRALAHRDAPSRFGRAAVLAGLAAAAECADESLAERARKSLAWLGVAAGTPERPSLEGLWSELPRAEPPASFEVLDPSPQSLAAAVSAFSAGDVRNATARFLDVFIRWAWRDRAGFIAFVRKAWPPHTWENPEAVNLAADWACGALTMADFEKEAAGIRHYHSGVSRPAQSEGWTWFSMPVTRALLHLHQRESLLAAGSIPCLLSTPSDESSVLAFGDLVARLRVYGDARCGELDLFQALLRLEPVDPARAVELDGITVAMRGRGSATRWRVPGIGRRSTDSDAVALVRQWVRGGGLPELTTHMGPDGIRVQPVSLPVALEAFPTVPPALFAGHQRGRDREFYDYDVSSDCTAAVVPHWPDLVVAKTASLFDQSTKAPPRWLPWLTTTGGSAGLPLHHAVAATLSHADDEGRLLAVDAALTLMAQRRFDASLFEQACLLLLGSGQLRLARTAAAWEQLMLGGGLKALWPALVAVVNASCEMRRKPAGLYELLAVARRYAPAVPGGSVPLSVAALAASSGSSKAHIEARAWARDGALAS
jgi:hypothetical protein